VSDIVITTIEGALLAAAIAAIVLLWIDLSTRKELLREVLMLTRRFESTEENLSSVSQQLTALRRDVERGFGTDDVRLARVRAAFEKYRQKVGRPQGRSGHESKS
jgi:hypothetical protein